MPGAIIHTSIAYMPIKTGIGVNCNDKSSLFNCNAYGYYNFLKDKEMENYDGFFGDYEV